MNLVRLVICTGMLMVGSLSFAVTPDAADPDVPTEAGVVGIRCCEAKNKLNEKRTDPSRKAQEETMAMLGAPNENAKGKSDEKSDGTK